MSDYTVLDRCLCCGSADISLLLDLHEQPLANSYHDGKKALPSYPLALNLCPKCFHAQQAVAVNPDLMFKEYLYVSGTSNTLVDYFDWFARTVDEKYGAAFGAKKSVLDIACNDGSQLSAFKKYGWDIWGVDPAENLLERSQATGATVICEYWNETSAKKLGRKFDILVAQNVFAHVGDPLGFLKACKLVMHEGSKLLIQTSQADMFVHGQFDTVYHEHISFFCTRSMRTLAERAGLKLLNVEITPVHGGSYVFTLGFDGDTKGAMDRENREEGRGQYSEAFYKKFADGARQIVVDLKAEIERQKQSGKKVIGYGAAAKGNTLLNFGGITLDYIVDDNPLKQSLYTPGMNILINSPDALAHESGDIALVPLAWNFFDEISQKVKALRPGRKDIFITYFPKVEIRG